ncbi:nuclear transport factor 2 family protein [Lutimonas halocynthiae]|uniref:nuclear transport factor 2 family protein n=1 Tax=Lutimonas halocynthiae TaxID=1446477 RepID=UPI0025B36B19|nr:nuclear transport factor 2 family protein [Lutimonas halocynthiae]MDN3643157.1 nuclear transport factor 2 family protein [Lutimonas halocynthiae]
MKKYNSLSIIIALLFVILSSCSEKKSDKPDIVNDLFPEVQNELREVIHSIVKDCETANLDGLKTTHLLSDKFTKFGPRSFERQDVESTNESELAFFGSVSNYKEEVKDLKIDVFGEIGIATFYRFVSFEQDGEEKNVNVRQTYVFLKTSDGWKIIHEHGNKP